MQKIFHFQQQAAALVDLTTLDQLSGSGDSPLHFALEACRTRRNDRGLLTTGLGVTHSCVDVGQHSVLHLASSIMSQVQIERLSHVAERLLSRLLDMLQTLRPLALDARHQPVVKVVPLTGDMRQQRCKRHSGIVARRTVAADSRSHQNCAAQNGPRIENGLVLILLQRDPVDERVENDIANNKTSVVARVVDQVRIPLTEQVVGSLENRVVVIVGPHVESQFRHPAQFEVSPHKYVVVRRLELDDRLLDHAAVRSRADASSVDKQWNRATPLVLVRGRFAIVFEDGERSKSKIIVELFQRPAHNAIRLVRVKWPSLSERCLEATAEEECVLMRLFAEMKQQIGVKILVRRQERIENEIDDTPSLADV